MAYNIEELKKIIHKNPNLERRFEEESWAVRYNKNTDMVIMGPKFSDNTFYYNVGDTGVMLRIDKDNHIHGFAIENAKFFLRKNPEFAVLSPFIYPVRSRIVFIVLNFLNTANNNLSSLFTMDNFIKRQACV